MPSALETGRQIGDVRPHVGNLCRLYGHRRQHRFGSGRPWVCSVCHPYSDDAERLEHRWLDRSPDAWPDIPPRERVAAQIENDVERWRAWHRDKFMNRLLTEGRI